MPKRSIPIYIGVDPGASGGLACISNTHVWAHHMPSTTADVWDWFIHCQVDDDSVAVIERVHAMPKQGVTSMFKFGQSYGMLDAMLTAVGIPYEHVLPSVWQRGLQIPSRRKTETRTEWKNRLKEKAQQLFPGVSITLKTADALLIAEYCKRKHAGTL